jgi:hypothetical protein
MKRSFIGLFGLALWLFGNPLAIGADNCCWDWSPGQRGKDDKQDSDPPKNDPTTKWAICTPTPTVGPNGHGNGSPCYNRGGRQLIWPDWECIVGSPPPLGSNQGANPPKNPPPPNGGFVCVKKGIGPPPIGRLRDVPLPDMPPDVPEVQEGIHGACFDWLKGDKQPSPLGSWLQCVPLLPADKPMCFAREGRQVYVPGWTCVVGSPSPSGEVPNPGNGFRAVDVDMPVPPGIAINSALVTDPPGGFPGKTLNVEPEDVPAVSALGLGLLVLLVVGGGTWLFRRHRAAGVAAT